MKDSLTWTRKGIEVLARRQPGRLVDLVLDLQNRIKTLEARLAQNSANSHRPPSSDSYHKPHPKSLRESAGRRPGGQNGHPGNTLRPTPSPDLVVKHPLTICPCGCGKNLRRLPLLRYERRQVFELPRIRLSVTEHRAEVKLCPGTGLEVMAAFPDGITAPAQYGTRFKSWLSYCRHQQLLPLERIAQMSRDIFDQPISEATIQAVETQLYQALAPFESTVKDLLRRAPLAHFDETGMRVAGKIHWLHCTSTAALTWYGIHPKRGAKAFDDFAILPQFQGRAIHDGWECYFFYKCLHGLCNAHHLRELVFMEEVLHQPWARKMRRLLLRMLKTVHQHAPKPVSPRSIAGFLRHYRAILAQALKRHPHRTSTHRGAGRPRQSKAHNLLRRLRDHESSVLAFLYDHRVPFTNNQAEQDLRMSKVRQKISGTFRTSLGAQRFARIRSYISTARKNRYDILGTLADALQNQPFMPRTPA